MTASFLSLLERARNADPAAIGEVIAEYGEIIQRELRFASLDRRIRQVVSDSDLVQSVWTSFFFELLSGRTEFNGPQKMAQFLRVVTRAKVADVARFWTSQRRDVRRNRSLGESDSADEESEIRTPDLAVVTAELLQAALGEMSQPDLAVLKWRHEGATWEVVATRLGEGATPEAARKQHERALARIAQRLNVSVEGLP